MTGIDLDALEATARAATLGPWETEGDMPDPSEVDTDRENGSER